MNYNYLIHYSKLFKKKASQKEAFKLFLQGICKHNNIMGFHLKTRSCNVPVKKEYNVPKKELNIKKPLKRESTINITLKGICYKQNPQKELSWKRTKINSKQPSKGVTYEYKTTLKRSQP
ncbi:MAG: hypothetical protein ACFFG0_04215 [Candidatus Thorarchaeota archaeon]